MPEYLKALIYILAMALLVFKFSELPATAVAMSKSSFVLRRNIWMVIAVAGFLSPDVWIFYIVAAYFLYKAAKKDSNRLAMFFFLIFAMPQLSAFVPGFAGINYFIEINYQRMLVCLLLLPIGWSNYVKSKNDRQSWNSVDILLVMYFLLNVALQFQYIVFTEWMRYVFGWFLDVLIPYYVISRCIKNIEDIREIAMAYVICAMLLSIVGVFEFNKQWLIYQSINDKFGLGDGFGYLIRGGNLRASVTTGQAIVMGYVVAIAICLYTFLDKSIPSRKYYVLGMVLLAAGEISPLSKGPWVGLFAGLILIMVLSPNAISRLSRILLFAVVVFVPLLFTDYGDSIISYLPFVGTLDEGSMEYRKLVLEKSLTVIFNNPYFGSNDYVLYLEELRQGQGIIDIVNGYIAIALNCGLVGLSIFLIFFLSVFWKIYWRMRLSEPVSEEHAWGRSMIGALVAIMIMISSVSDISYVPIMYWSLAAMGVAYARMDSKRQAVFG